MEEACSEPDYMDNARGNDVEEHENTENPKHKGPAYKHGYSSCGTSPGEHSHSCLPKASSRSSPAAELPFQGNSLACNTLDHSDADRVECSCTQVPLLIVQLALDCVYEQLTKPNNEAKKYKTKQISPAKHMMLD